MIFGLTRANLSAAAQDLQGAFTHWRIWHLLAGQDIKQRYRRATIGAFWLTASMAVQIVTISVVVTFLFKSSIQELLPYVCVGLLFWTLMSSILTEGSSAFVNAQAVILQIRLPLTVYIMQTLWRNIIILGHNVIVLVAIYVIRLTPPSPWVLLAPLTLAIVLVAFAWIPMFLAVVSTRFRDIPTMVGSSLGILFWLTPIMYFPEQLGDRRIIIDVNPLTHALVSIRDPLLGTHPPLSSVALVVLFGIVGWSITFLFFARFRARVPYWL